jgi:hypothetical protein
MGDKLRAGTAALAMLCGIATTATVAMAQTNSAPTPPATTSSITPAPAPAPGQASGPIAPTQDQVAAFLQSLEDFAGQSVSGYQPTVGSPVPPHVKTQPMPPDAAATVPAAKDHHVAKTDDGTVLIVNPITRELVGLVSILTGDDDGTDSNTSNSKDSGTNSSK